MKIYKITEASAYSSHIKEVGQMVLIETIGFDMRPLYVAKDKILGIKQKDGNPQQSALIMVCGAKREEWVINESVLIFRVKYDNT